MLDTAMRESPFKPARARLAGSAAIKMAARRRGRTSGHNVVEMSALLIVVVAVGLFFLDVATVLLANIINDEACRNACRSAADASPITGTQNNWQSTAQGVLNRWKAGGYIVQSPTLDVGASGPVWHNGPPSQAAHVYEGSMRIKTTITVDVPFTCERIVPLPSRVTFSAQEQLPITYIQPNQTYN
ncbi:MAG: hypothetical protein ACREBW_07875 [Candidatus Micrarchaeaceae archaeon]